MHRAHCVCTKMHICSRKKGACSWVCVCVRVFVCVCVELSLLMSSGFVMSCGHWICSYILHMHEHIHAQRTALSRTVISHSEIAFQRAWSSPFSSTIRQRTPGEEWGERVRARDAHTHRRLPWKLLLDFSHWAISVDLAPHSQVIFISDHVIDAANSVYSIKFGHFSFAHFTVNRADHLISSKRQAKCWKMNSGITTQEITRTKRMSPTITRIKRMSRC